MCWPVEFLPNKLIYSKETTLMIGSMLAFALNSCGGNEKEQKEEEPANALEAIQQMAKEAEEMQNKEPVEPIDFRKLKELLPATAAGLSRTEATGKKNGAMGFSFSQAEGKYGEGDSSIEIQILDTGGIGGMGMMGLAAWSIAEVDKETATGYEKTTKIDGNKAYEKYDNDQKDGEIERPRK
jgi:type II secretory pathway pseudopilin PulG